ncbi:nucleolar complex protein 4 homolog [Lingula anatina]|uniref:Nucleolar complex protein 4 homolog n=1 Tax=Lingula anatina TaxID=7574 RepID=A0A1S3H2G6_LINAN|nr:nucleolar complex protein 4 homolog [Lingula anatina]|eukprot:XP_013379671.1 nucleolar complex protein 4 homolog [Lingula anatina]
MPSNTRKDVKFSNKNEIKSIKSKTKEFLCDRKNANCLVDIISLSESEEEEVILACIRAFYNIFSNLITHGSMYLERIPTTKDDVEDLSSEEQYRCWLRERYSDVSQRMLELITHQLSTVQELALCTLMKFVAAEGQNPLRKLSEKHLAFPAVLFEKLLLTLLSEEIELRPLIVRFQEFLEYDDVRYYAMKIAHKVLKEKPNHEQLDIYHGNVYALLEQLSLPATDEEKLINFMTKMPDTNASLKINTLRDQKKLFTSLWLEFLRKRLPTSLYKKVLVILHDKVMPYMTSPLLLSDFLTESYNIGGAVSLLALNGLFMLIHTYNLDYPDFYKKLYALFEPNVFHVKYRARFFHLADLFLTSTHLPAYLVAAFAKRLSRLALTVPPCGLLIILPFIYNLLIRHPSCRVLIHRPDTTKGEFTLLENTLQNHYHHEVAMWARKIEQPFPKLEFPLADVLDLTTDQMIEKEMKKKIKEVPVTFEAPYGLLGNKEHRLQDYWALE